MLYYMIWIKKNMQQLILYSTRATRVWLIYHFDFEHLDKYKQVIEIKNVV